MPVNSEALAGQLWLAITWGTLCIGVSVGGPLLNAQDRLSRANEELNALNVQIGASDRSKPLPDVSSAMRRLEAEFAAGIMQYLNTASHPSANDLSEVLRKAAAAPIVLPELASNANTYGAVLVRPEIPVVCQ